MKKTIIKFSVSIIFGIGMTFLFVVILLDSLFYDPAGLYEKTGTFDLILSLIMYLSGVLFLILWNKKTSKFVYLLFIVPIICIAVGIGNNEYQKLIYKKICKEYIEYQKIVENIATVSEHGLSLWQYMPFRQNNLLAKLEEISALKLIVNLPILDGATAFFPVYSSFVQTVYPEGDYSFSKGQLLCSRTEKAYENLLEGVADIIFCLEPSDLHFKQFHDKGLRLKLIPIGREAFVFFVNKENPINNLTIENIRDIYSGKVINWEELNGINQNIMAFQRQKNSGSQTIFEKIMENIPVIKPRMEYVAFEMGEIINMIANYRNFPNAIGYSFLQYSTEMVKNDQIKLLSINGIFPSNQTIQNESYPFSEYFYAIYIDREDKNENIELFIEWILSGQGQKLISKTGYIAIDN